MSEPGALTYTAGASVALVAPGAALVFAQSPTGETVARCWPLIRDRAGVEVIIEALAAGGMASMPGFALVCVDGSGAGVVVRGPGRAVSLDADGATRTLDADGLVTWLETRLDAAVAAVTIGVTADLPGPAVLAPGFPVVGGTVLAGSVTVSLAGADASAPPPVAPVLDAPSLDALAPSPAESRVTLPELAAAQPPPPAEAVPAAVSPATPASPLSVSVTVQAVACPYGHLSPTYEPYCRLCGTAIEDTRPFLAERPPLGLLRLSTGDVVPLDRGVVLGRNPRAVDEQDSGRPHLVRLPSPDNDVSRNHVEVRLADWHVLVVDLGSTNGTTVTIPGQAPVRLRAHDPVPIEPNTEVNLADEIVFRFEVPTA